MAPFTTSLTTSAVVQNSNAGEKQLVRYTLILKSTIYTLIYICLFTLFVYIIICLLFLGGRGGRSGISKPRNLRGFRDASGQLVFDPDDENLSDKELYARNIPAIGRINL